MTQAAGSYTVRCCCDCHQKTHSLLYQMQCQNYGNAGAHVAEDMILVNIAIPCLLLQQQTELPLTASINHHRLTGREISNAVLQDVT